MAEKHSIIPLGHTIRIKEQRKPKAKAGSNKK